MTIIDRDVAWQAVHDTATSATQLAEIAGEHPEFAEAIARHPNAYPELKAWADRVSVPSPPAAAVSPYGDAQPAGAGAPTALAASTTPLTRPGAVTDGAPDPAHRWWISTAIVVGVLAIINPVSWLVLPYEVVGSAPVVWFSLIAVLSAGVLPIIAASKSAQTGGRKIGAIVLASAALLLILFTALQNGAIAATPGYYMHSLPFWGLNGLLWMTGLFVAWALSWPIRGLGYLGLVLLAIGSLGSWLTYAGSVFSFVVILLAAGAVATALLISRAVDRRQPVAAAPFGAALAPAGPYGPAAGAYAPAAGVQKTNTMAILSLVFAFLFSILGVVFGHIALGQTHRTGEQGRGLAIAGLVIGYAGIVLGLILLVTQIAAFNALMSYSGY